MPIDLKCPECPECPECQKPLRAHERLAGRVVKCTACGAAVPIPEAIGDEAPRPEAVPLPGLVITTNKDEGIRSA